jgi:hypothetical protein
MRKALLPTDCRFQVVDTELQLLADRRAKLVVVLQEIEARP